MVASRLWNPEFFWLRLRSIQIFFKLEHETWWKVVHLYWKWFQKLVFRYSYTYIKKADICAFMLDTWKFHSYLYIKKADICALDIWKFHSYLCIKKADICALDTWKFHSYLCFCICVSRSQIFVRLIDGRFIPGRLGWGESGLVGAVLVVGGNITVAPTSTATVPYHLLYR